MRPRKWTLEKLSEEALKYNSKAAFEFGNSGIEFDDTYWHTLAGLKTGREHWPESDLNDYHTIKDSCFASKGITILYIREEDWLKNKKNCIEKCLNFLKS